MIILGLGTNIGDRLAHLRSALCLIKKIPQLAVQQVSPVYISDALLPENAPAAWDRPHLNLALRCETTLTPYALLHHTKQIEKHLGSGTKEHWGPRVIDIDLLAWDNRVHYDNTLHVPHEHLPERPFALWPLADVAPHWSYPLPGPFQGKTANEIAAPWGSRFDGQAPLHTQQIQQRIDTPQLVGIINLSPDSFSTTEKQHDTVNIWQQVEDLVNAGADIIDLGAEATGPTALPLSPNTEWQRLAAILTEVLAKRPLLSIPPKISVDTRHAAVAKKALALGVDWINDVSGLEDSAMQRVTRDSQCDLVFMHHLGIPAHKNKYLPLAQDPATLIYAWAIKRIQELENVGIARERLIFDPGIGYGKTATQSWALIKNIAVFQKLGVRLLVGHSRKSFLTQFTAKPPAERDLETVITSLLLAQQKVNYLRVHNVAVHTQAFKVALG
jgi:2-amino-4-hydroxy-6-hydroxymethyldihydropteridine diphosphokinase/dihydropteroate synthase